MSHRQPFQCPHLSESRTPCTVPSKAYAPYSDLQGRLSDDHAHLRHHRSRHMAIPNTPLSDVNLPASRPPEALSTTWQEGRALAHGTGSTRSHLGVPESPTCIPIERSDLEIREVGGSSSEFITVT
ncbi:hypothetical protein GW17_00003655 [Ensete ventricosum]|nr:hypothetical protein GW17_00003655 [Ensete ventricosum]